MKKHPRALPRARLLGCVTGWILLAALLFNGCTTRGAKLDHDSDPARRIAYAQACAPFAAMSALAYDPEKEPADLQARRGAIERYLSDRGWTRLPEFSPTKKADQGALSAESVGLAYEVWINRTFHPAVVVIAVRGTEFTDVQDWKSNLWWVTRHFSPRANQYRQAPAAAELGRVFAHFKAPGQTDQHVIITTGHSLGGGVAQCLRYAFPREVAQCYAFNSSPVTGFHDSHGLDEAAAGERRATFNQMLPLGAFPAHRTLRIYEKGEVLAYLRGQMRIFNPIDEKIIEVRWNFDEIIAPIRNHGMLSFAEKILLIATDPHAELAKGYEPWWRKEGPPPPGALAQDAATKIDAGARP